MIEKNCLTCKNFMMHEIARKGNKNYSQGFTFGQEKRPCKHYPNNLSTAKDIMEGYCCDKYIVADFINPVEDHITNTPFNTPFSMAIPLISGSISGSINSKATEKLDKALRRLYLIVGLFIGIMFGIITMQAIYILMGKL